MNPRENDVADIVEEMNVERRPREDGQGSLFGGAASETLEWKRYWWGMPGYDMKDVRPQHRITINFMSEVDVLAFAEKTGLPVTTRSDTAWFPHQAPLRGEYRYAGPKTDSRYPVCVPSKGRAGVQTTGRLLDRLGVSYRFFVEDTEADDYIRRLGRDRVVVMPFHDLGQGSIPARNFIWDWAASNGHARHWVVDDNIANFYRAHANRRLTVRGGGFFRAMEDFVDRYANVVMAGPHDIAFVSDRTPDIAPVVWNTRVYSCILLATSLAERWRGRYNEDTDLSLRLLKQGYVTAVFRALCMDKPGTVGSRNANPLPGGNTDNVYDAEDHRLAFAKSLEEQHPDCVKVVWKYNRWHHQVDYTAFDRNTPVYNPGVVPSALIDDYGMRLVRTGDENGSPP